MDNKEFSKELKKGLGNNFSRFPSEQHNREGNLL
jgi:hypothetical protein